MKYRHQNRRTVPVTGIQFAASGLRKPAVGFTLIEILIAIFIFSIIVTIIFASYNSVFVNAETTDQGIISHEMAKNCINRMIIDIESIHISRYPEYEPPDFDDPPDPYRILGGDDYVEGTRFPRLRFASLAHVSLRGKRQEGVAEVVYYVASVDKDHFILKRSDNLLAYQPFEEKASDPVLCENLTSLEFKYYEADGETRDSWDSDAKDFGYATPKAIGIKLAIDSGSGSLTFETIVAPKVYRKKKE
jgi:general secretion pathway protein J